MDNLVSVIVPVYNVEAYLAECLQSILAQTYKNLEILLIDDGSTDLSPDICNNAAQTDIRIKVYHRKNQGVSAARNYGVSVASGEYIMFVDSDDCLEARCIQILMNDILKEQADLAISATVDRTQKPTYLIRPDNHYTLLTTKQAMEFLLKNQSLCCPWGKIYKKEVLIGIPFPVNQRYEDLAVMHLMIHQASKIVYTEDILYFYRDREGSFIDTQFTIEKLDRVNALYNRAEFIKSTYPDLYKYSYAQYVGGMALAAYDLFPIHEKECQRYYHKYITEIKHHYKNIFYNCNLGKREYLFVILIKLNRYLFEFSCRILYRLNK